MRQAPNLGRILCRSIFQSQHKNREVKNCGKNCVSCHYLLKASLYQFKLVKKTFLLKNSFNCESSNLIYADICKEEYIGETGFLVKEQYQQMAEHLRTCGDGKFYMFPFFKIIQENKSLRNSYKDYFIDKFKPLLNKKT